MTAIIALLGGVRGTIFAGIALALLIAAGIQHHNLGQKQDKIDGLNAQALVWEAANRDNVKALADLRKANAAWANQARDTERKAARAVEAVSQERDALAARVETLRRERGEIYDRNPDAAAWGREPVPGAIADQLRGQGNRPH